jgi:predicted dienelactone hydrolase
MCGKFSGRRESLRKYPIILFSPGLGTTRLFYGVLAQSVAKWGYIVVVIHHPYDVNIVEYSDGSSISGYTPTFVPPQEQAETATAVRVQDVTFVLNELGGDSFAKNHLSGLTRNLDVTKVRIYGHSIGGATAAAAMLGDHRLAGGLNLDGEYYGSVIKQELDRPLLQFDSTGHNRYNLT